MYWKGYIIYSMHFSISNMFIFKEKDIKRYGVAMEEKSVTPMMIRGYEFVKKTKTCPTVQPKVTPLGVDGCVGRSARDNVEKEGFKQERDNVFQLMVESVNMEVIQMNENAPKCALMVSNK